jgi:peptidoglycan/LPS O-acetylase OafA/YrhL
MGVLTSIGWAESESPSFRPHLFGPDAVLRAFESGGMAPGVEFLYKEAFRLFPLSWFFILFTWISGIPQASVHPHVLQGLTIGPKVLLSNLTLTQNVLGAPDILGQLWSLPSVEYVPATASPFLAQSKVPARIRFAAWPIAGVVGLLHVYSLRSLLGMWRLNVLTFLPCFVPGVMAYVLCRQKQPFLNSLLWPLSLITLVFVFLLRPSWPFAWIVALAVGLSVVLFKEQPRPYLHAVTRSIAKYSYGIYLGHTLCIWVAFSVLHRSPWYAQVLGYAILLVTIPALCFRVIEKPCIDLGKRIADSLRPVRPESSLGRERVLAKSA